MSRARTQQPQYDFIAGGDEAPPSQPLVRKRSLSVVRNGMNPPNPPSDSTGRPHQQKSIKLTEFTKGDDDLRERIHKLQYEIDSLKQERELTRLRNEDDLRAIRAKADEDYKRAQASETSTSNASHRYNALAEELRLEREKHAQDCEDLESKLRDVRGRSSNLEEELEESRGAIGGLERGFKRDIADLQAKSEGLERASEDLRLENERLAKGLETAQSRLVQKEDEVGKLENEVLRLKAATGDADTLEYIKRELSEQVAHIQKLEALNRTQAGELKSFRKHQKSMGVVEEEKRTLETKVLRMDDLRRELNECQLQKSILEEEKNGWAAYLESEGLGFNTPGELARAFMAERVERASLIEQLGRVKPELSEKDEIIQGLELEKASLKEQVAKAQGGDGAPDAKVRARLERQRALAQKEVEYLRAQAKDFESEEAAMSSEKFDEIKSKRITELEDLLDQHRQELQQLHTELSKLETPQAEDNSLPRKRPRTDDVPDERLGSLTRKNRALQDEVSTITSARKILEKELEVTKSQLKSLKKGSSQRILELRNNPTSQVATIKQSTLDTLRAENESLLAKIDGLSDQENAQAIPSATLDRLRKELEAKDEVIKSKDKHALRLRQIFAAKSNEFREAVASILGWKMDFMPNGRVRVTSMFYPAHPDEEGSNSIVFDGEAGTMKCSGGEKSAFAGEIKGLINFWVDGKKEIPCFLAATTLEFWERTTRAQKM